jgi:preprotein translocase subunit SecE
VKLAKEEEQSMKFLKSVVNEMKLVTWPTAKETRRDTTTVIVTSILFAIYFALADWAITALLTKFIF